MRIPVSDSGVSLNTLGDVLYQKKNLEARRYCEFIATTKPCAPRISAFLVKLNRTPKIDGVPLSKIYFWTHGTSWGLRTSSWSEKPVPANFFKYPSDFKIAKNFEEVEYTKESQQDLEDAFRGLDLGNEHKASSSKTNQSK